MHNLPGWLAGSISLIFLLFLTLLFATGWSRLPSHIKKINFRTVFMGIFLQILIMFLLLKMPGFQSLFEFLSAAFVKVISFADTGINFLLRSFKSGEVEPPLLNFAFKVLPTIIFFSALMSILYYLNIIPYVVYGMGWVMKKVMGASGIESLVAAGNIFVGQTEAPLLVRPYLKYAT